MGEPIKTSPADLEVVKVAVTPRNGSPSVSGAPAREDDPEEAAIRRLFSALGGAGSIKVSRCVDGEERYCGSIKMVEGVELDIDDRLARLFGGGEFALKGFVSGRYVAGVRRQIDSVAFPPKTSEAEARRGEMIGGSPGGASSAGPSHLDLLAVSRDAEDRARRDRQDLLAAISSLEEKRTQQLAALASALRGSMTPAPASAGLDTLKEAISLVRSFGWGPPDGSSPPPDAPAAPSAGEGLMEGVLKSAAAAAGARVGDAVARAMGPAAPAPAASAPAPAASAPAASSVKLPPGARPLSADQMAKIRAKRGGGAPK